MDVTLPWAWMHHQVQSGPTGNAGFNCSDSRTLIVSGPVSVHCGKVARRDGSCDPGGTMWPWTNRKHRWHTLILCQRQQKGIMGVDGGWGWFKATEQIYSTCWTRTNIYSTCPTRTNIFIPRVEPEQTYLFYMSNQNIFIPHQTRTQIFIPHIQPEQTFIPHIQPEKKSTCWTRTRNTTTSVT